MFNVQRLRLNVLVTVATINTVTDFEGNYNGVNSPNYKGKLMALITCSNKWLTYLTYL